MTLLEGPLLWAFADLSNGDVSEISERRRGGLSDLRLLEQLMILFNLALSVQVELQGFAFQSRVDGRDRKGKLPEVNLVVAVTAQPPDNGVYFRLGDVFVILLKEAFEVYEVEIAEVFHINI